MSPTDKWDSRFMQLSRLIASWSRDPSTQVGAVIVDPAKRIVSVGFNGFPRGVRDCADRYDDRETKYKFVVHAEANALSFARRDLTGCALYCWPMPPCSRCAGLIVQAGITLVVAPPLSDETAARWAADVEATRIMFREAEVFLRFAPVHMDKQ